MDTATPRPACQGRHGGRARDAPPDTSARAVQRHCVVPTKVVACGDGVLRLSQHRLAKSRADIAKILHFAWPHRTPGYRAQCRVACKDAQAWFDRVWTMSLKHVLYGDAERWALAETLTPIESGMAAACIQLGLMRHARMLLPWDKLATALATDAVAGTNGHLMVTLIKEEVYILTCAIAAVFTPSFLQPSPYRKFRACSDVG